jgi:hypothetical protein
MPIELPCMVKVAGAFMGAAAMAAVILSNHKKQAARQRLKIFIFSPFAHGSVKALLKIIYYKFYHRLAGCKSLIFYYVLPA